MTMIRVIQSAPKACYRMDGEVIKMVGHAVILVPVDFSPECREVLAYADNQAATTGSSLLILHVIQYRDPMRQRPPVILLDPLEDCARSIKKIPEARVSVLGIEGEPVAKILQTAESYRCQSIVMGRGGTAETPGHVAAGVKKGFHGFVHWVSASAAELPQTTPSS